MKRTVIRRYRLKGRQRIGYPPEEAGKNADRKVNRGEEREKELLRIAFLTDIHNCAEGPEGERLFALLAQCRPDLVLLGGDVVLGKPGGDIRPALRLVKRLSEQYRVVYANGNHELRISRCPEEYGPMGRRYDQELAKLPVLRLLNEKAELNIRGIPITVYGLNMSRDCYNKRLQKKRILPELQKQFGEPDLKRYTILLAHHPCYYKDYLNWGADLTLSGHYHGGIFLLGKHTGLITPDFRLFSSLCCGMRRQGRSRMIVSAGLGEHTVPLRIHNPRELTLVEVEFARQRPMGEKK